jgi:hypothetical protein
MQAIPRLQAMPSSQHQPILSDHHNWSPTLVDHRTSCCIHHHAETHALPFWPIANFSHKHHSAPHQSVPCNHHGFVFTPADSGVIRAPRRQGKSTSPLNGKALPYIPSSADAPSQHWQPSHRTKRTYQALTVINVLCAKQTVQKTTPSHVHDVVGNQNQNLRQSGALCATSTTANEQ